MDREPDLLALILTSHGSPAGVAVQAGRRVEILSPRALAGLLDGAGVRHRIVIISACYSGVFLGPLANDDSLVITAADSEHSSFGCQDKVKWTYFGDAFFNTALRHTADLRQAFDEARDRAPARAALPSRPFEPANCRRQKYRWAPRENGRCGGVGSSSLNGLFRQFSEAKHLPPALLIRLQRPLASSRASGPTCAA